MRAVIISGGFVNNYDVIKRFFQKNDTVICADSGYDHAVSMGISPEVVVGDFDSISKIPDNITVVKYPTRKNYTDTEIAIEWARERGFKHFLILCATGGRMDHTLANLYLLSGMPQKGEYGEIITEHERIIPVTNSKILLSEPAGTVVSVIPLTKCQGVYNENMEYPLFNETLYTDSARGMSNIIKKSPASIEVRSGTFFVIVNI